MEPVPDAPHAVIAGAFPKGHSSSPIDLETSRVATAPAHPARAGAMHSRNAYPCHRECRHGCLTSCSSPTSHAAYVCLEIVDQLLDGREGIRLLLARDMPVIALAALVVIADKPLAFPAIEQAVLQLVTAPGNRFRHFPDLHLHDRSVGQHLLVMVRERRLHMAYHAIV